MASIQTAKKELRQRMRCVLQSLPPEAIAAQCAKITSERLCALPEYQQAQRIGVYLSMPAGELSTTAIVQDALARGKEVFIPYIHRVEAEPAQSKRVSVMDMLALTSMAEFEALVPDRWGIPSLQAEQVTDRDNCFGGQGVSPRRTIESTGGDRHGLDLIVMPGMAFDTGFRRLGHGKGYYDYFLTRFSKNEAQSKSGTLKMPFLGKKPTPLRRTNRHRTHKETRKKKEEKSTF
ncbi:hypothetical protein ASPZODRAFT_137088 [Penicilliopsis zonata CBS 506.65]|uniref:5-formyltetrahydrofolate cyclo-ligase n=1 Tax=Penicilliopsis zonata CBS 506.65 TaxID=1073090 RepID=A0A1L9S6B7_9EURO|nr:hypothetical protein ASPZODRAFT_137088 [Penicilliopsis zonata CBS 506.65]OJJ42700.1 hypothetical protein ASPZODRAFT_137088 [Penicilliopsis zonata CBS 506.65]